MTPLQESAVHIAMPATSDFGLVYRFENLAYLVGALLFILALAGLSKQTKARRGNLFGMFGMGLALVATVWVVIVGDVSRPVITALLIGASVAAGAAVGVMRARSVEMTEMPELIAMLHSFVGLAAVIV